MSEKAVALEVAQAEVILRAEQNFQRQLDWIGRYDTRSATILGISVAMLGFLATQAPPPEVWDRYCVASSLLSVALIGYSLWMIYVGQYPKTDSPNKSLLYFDTIAGTEVKEFLEKFRMQTHEGHLEDLCYQTHQNAWLISKKFSALKKSLRAILIAIAPWSFAIIWFQIVKP